MIHRYWHGSGRPTGPDPTGELHRGLLVDWDDVALPGLVVEWLNRGSDQVSHQTQELHRSNMLRWWLLAEYGGVWVDWDVEARVRLDQLEVPFVAAHISPCTSIMGFPKGHPVPASAMFMIDQAGPSDRESYDVSGELLLAQIITPDVELIPLPHDAAGQPLPGGTDWAEHYYYTSSRRSR